MVESRVSTWLYNDAHLLGAIGDAGEVESLHHSVWDLLVNATSAKYLSKGWRFIEKSEGIEAQRGDIRLKIPTADAAHWIEDMEGGVLLLNRFRPRSLYGWHSFVGLHGPPRDPDLRLYLPEFFHAGYLSALLSKLDQIAVHWTGKISNTASTLRPDRVVIYATQAELPQISAEVLRTREEFGLLPGPAPGFSYEVDSSIFGAYSDAGSLESHGQNTARRIARLMANPGDIHSQEDKILELALRKEGFTS